MRDSCDPPPCGLSVARAKGTFSRLFSSIENQQGSQSVALVARRREKGRVAGRPCCLAKTPLKEGKGRS